MKIITILVMLVMSVLASIAAARALMAVTATGAIPVGAINDFRTRVGPALTAIDAALR